MPVHHIPKDYQAVIPYLIAKPAEKLLDFIKQTFVVEERERVTRPDGGIMHAEVKIGDSTIMVADPMGEYGPMAGSLYVYVEDVDAAYQRALDAGATSTMAPMDMFYGDRNGGVKDTFGNIWWIATHKEDVPPEELQRRAEAAMKHRSGGAA